MNPRGLCSNQRESELKETVTEKIAHSNNQNVQIILDRIFF